MAILAIVAIFSRESQGSTNILTTFVAGGVTLVFDVKLVTALDESRIMCVHV